MQNIDVRELIDCPICGHSVRFYGDELGRIVWCYWCGTVATLEPSMSVPTDDETARALQSHARELRGRRDELMRDRLKSRRNKESS